MNILLKFFVNGPVWTVLLKFLFLPKLREVLSAEALAARRVLEIGCGRGASTEVFRKWFKTTEIIATDYDAEQIAFAKKTQASLKDVVFAQADACALPHGNGTFDLVIETNTFHHIDNWKKAIEEAARVIKPGGFFVIMDESAGLTGFLPFRLIDRPDAVFSREDFARELEKRGMMIEIIIGKLIFYIIAKKV